MTTQTIDPAEQARIDKLISDIVAIVDETIGLQSYEAADLAEKFASPNFYEFWTNGKRSSSYKIYTNSGVPFIVDQYNRKDMVKPIKAANAKIEALFV